MIVATSIPTVRAGGVPPGPGSLLASSSSGLSSMRSTGMSERLRYTLASSLLEPIRYVLRLAEPARHRPAAHTRADG